MSASNWPTTVRYTERLATDAQGLLSPQTFDVTIPSTRDDAFDLIATINRLAATDFPQWKAAVRMYTACDWYVLGLFMSGAQRLDPFTGRPEMDCDFLWNLFREMQFDSDNLLDTSARGHFKTHARAYVGATNIVVNDPNAVIAIVAHEKLAASKHGIRTGLEWERNVELKTAWDDVFFGDPKKDPDCPLWNQETGYTVKRTIASALPTLSWHGIENVPTGARVSLFIFDDLENESTVESDSQREKVLKRFASFKQLAGRMPRVWINGTYHHPNGLVAHINSSKMYRVRCRPAEDVSRPAPDIAALYDACGGRLQLRGEDRVVDLPPEIRNIRLDGAPVFLHPLEIALKRLDAMSTPNGLADYYRQNMGDPLAGEDKRFREEWVRRYTVAPKDIAEGSYIYVTVDASKGVNDPTFAMVNACLPDGSIALVDGLRRRIEPSEFGREIWSLMVRWEHIGIIKGVRFEVFGQATWDTHFMAYCELTSHWPGGITEANVKAIGRNTKNRNREWMALQPLYKGGRRQFPEDGVLWVEDEKGHRIDLVRYYLDYELLKFPLPIYDDGLAADALLGEPEDRKKGIYALEFPETDEAAELRELKAQRWAHRSGRFRDYDDRDTRYGWMEEGL